MGEEKQEIQRFSFSKLSTYHTCLVSFIASYILKLPQTQNAFASYGSLMHLLLQEFAQNKLEIYDLLTEFENRYEENVPEEFPKLRNGKSMEDGYYDDAIRYLSSFSGFGEYKVLAAEEVFEVQVEDFIFNGVIDLILEDLNGDIVIMDHKSKKTFADEDEEKIYRRQLYLYCLHIHNKYGKYPIKLKFNMFRNLDVLSFEFKQEEFDEAVNWMLETVKEIKKIYCDYDYFFCNHLCGYGKICHAKREMESNKTLKEYIKRENKKKVTNDC